MSRIPIRHIQVIPSRRRLRLTWNNPELMTVSGLKLTSILPPSPSYQEAFVRTRGSVNGAPAGRGIAYPMNFFTRRVPDVGEKADEIGTAMTAGGFAMDFAGLHVQRRVQRERAMAAIFKPMLFGPPRSNHVSFTLHF